MLLTIHDDQIRIIQQVKNLSPLTHGGLQLQKEYLNGEINEGTKREFFQKYRNIEKNTIKCFEDLILKSKAQAFIQIFGEALKKNNHFLLFIVTNNEVREKLTDPDHMDYHIHSASYKKDINNLHNMVNIIKTDLVDKFDDKAIDRFLTGIYEIKLLNRFKSYHKMKYSELLSTFSSCVYVEDEDNKSKYDLLDAYKLPIINNKSIITEVVEIDKNFSALFEMIG